MLQNLRQKSTPKAQKIICLIFALIALFLCASLCFTPFCLYQTFTQSSAGSNSLASTNNALTPLSVLYLLAQDGALKSDVAILGLVLFIVWVLYVAFMVALFFRLLFRLTIDADKFKKMTKSILIFATVGTGVYFLSGLIFNLINRASGGLTSAASNIWNLVVMLIFDAFYAVFAGVIAPSAQPQKDLPNLAPEVKNKRKQLILKKVEFFVFASVLIVLVLISYLTQIVSVEYANMPEQNFTMNGLDLLNNYASAELGGQILAFVILVILTLTVSLYLISLLALIGKSKAFFRFTLYSVIASCLGCFIIGMYGKYYEMVHSLNIEALVAWVKQKYSTVAEIINVDAVKTDFLNGYVIRSSTIYYFLGAIALCGVLIFRKSYSSGLALERELNDEKTDLTAQIENSQITVAQPSDQDAQAELEQNATNPINVIDPCPAFTEIDQTFEQLDTQAKAKLVEHSFDQPTLPKLVQFIVQYARDSRLHLFYTEEDIAAFIAGLGSTRLTILQGMSGTGKTSLPKIFSEALFSNCEIVEVESSWRDKNELLGYYNEFSKIYTPKKFTQALYRACLNTDTLTFIVLDEMNLSRIEYYFSDFLSLMENEPDRREIKLLNVGLFRTEDKEKFSYKALSNGHTIKILPNVWFIGTANRDESTFEISDKVYDRAHTMNFNKRAKTAKCFNQPIPQRFISATQFNKLLDDAKNTKIFSIDDYPLIAQVESLLAPYNISFGNRIALQIEQFVSIYCACFSVNDETIFDAVERILLTKVVAKLELKSIEDKHELASQFKALGLLRCSDFISKLNED